MWHSLIPVLKAAGEQTGMEVLYDQETFEAGENLERQEADFQASADATVCVLSPNYRASEACQREMDRAIWDQNGIPLIHQDCEVPWEFEELLQVDLRDPSNNDEWTKLLRKLGAEDALGVCAAKWLETGREAVHLFEKQGQSVNLSVGTTGVNWKALLKFVIEPGVANLQRLDLQSGVNATRKGICESILRCAGLSKVLPSEKGPALVEFSREMERVSELKLAMQHFDWVAHQERAIEYGESLFGDWRTHVENGRLRILAISRASVRQLLPPSSHLSNLGFQTVEL